VGVAGLRFGLIFLVEIEYRVNLQPHIWCFELATGRRAPAGHGKIKIQMETNTANESGALTSEHAAKELTAFPRNQSVSRKPQPVTRKPQLAVRNTQPATRNTQHEPVFSVNLGLIDYNRAWRLQSALVAARLNRSHNRDFILFLEHPAVFTLGRRGGRNHLLVKESFLKQSGIPIIQVERGGYITFHGPGQLVVYTIIDLASRRLGVTDFVAALEEIMLQTVRTWGLTAQRSSINPGIWMGNRKMGSIGIALRKGICFHGLSLNVNVDLTPFSWIQPCGLDGVSMTSVKQELGKKIPIRVARQTVKKQFQSVLELDLIDLSYPDLQHQL
jgi:lipoate-protein ligase B